ncbi:MAG TPA: glycosyltransferase family 2 protein [Anaerolineales bacterium]|nr:glycosyltransferase family 2 protein [Anaerolineales bacterium]
MKLSIVTPSFNQSSFLDQTIRSVLSQEGVEIEYLVMDGSSTDGSLDIIEHHAARLAWWTSESDRGQGDALRKGFARANGDVLAWVNSDDLLAPGAARSALAALERHPEADLVYGNAASIDPDGRPLNDMLFRPYSAADLAAFHIICQPAVFFRREAYLRAGGLDPSFHFLLDHDLWLRIAARGSIRYVPELWAFARQHPDAKNVAQAERFGEEAHRIVDRLRTDPAYAEIYPANERRIRAAALRFEARYLLDAGRDRAAFRTYLRSLRTHPATAFVEWHRIIFAGLSAIGLGGLGAVYYRRKRRRGSQQLRGVANVADLY